MVVIAMTREMGTRGKDVAAALERAFGLEVVHHELVERQLAERMDVRESLVHRFLEGQESLWDRWRIDPKRLSQFTSEEVLQLAQRGNVLIRGWGASQLLRDVAHVICVRICAPMDLRIAEMMKRLDVSDRKAIQREIERNDGAHSRLIERQFQKDYRDPVNYDIVLNTGFVEIETCVDAIRPLIDSPRHQQTDESSSRLADRLIEARCRTVLDTHVAGSPLGSGVHVEVKRGAVSLSGVIDARVSMNSAIEAIEKIEGVTSVTNNVMQIRQGYGV